MCSFVLLHLLYHFVETNRSQSISMLNGCMRFGSASGSVRAAHGCILSDLKHVDRHIAQVYIDYTLHDPLFRSVLRHGTESITQSTPRCPMQRAR